jgi:hypothetical protein
VGSLLILSHRKDQLVQRRYDETERKMKPAEVRLLGIKLQQLGVRGDLQASGLSGLIECH